MTDTDGIGCPGDLAFAEHHALRFTRRSRCRQADPSFYRLERFIGRCLFQQGIACLPGNHLSVGASKALCLLRSFNKQDIRSVLLSYAGLFFIRSIWREWNQHMTATEGAEPDHGIDNAAG